MERGGDEGSVDEQFELPMFPLGSVLFPRAVLPLHVFEPRYRALVRDCLDATGLFGVVLIERGHEVGGGDTRFALGTIARIVRAEELPDGRWRLVAVGTERIAVHEWLDEQPYPRALVVRREDRLPSRDAGTLVDDVRAALVRVHALRAELGLPARTGEVAESENLVDASYQAAILAPIGSLDAQRLLDVDDPVERLERTAELLMAEIEVLQFRLSG